jgi:hypothetical protein
MPLPPVVVGGVVIDQNHIFCGDVIPGPPNIAGGFHSRPGGLNPVTIAPPAPPPGTGIVIPPGAPAGIYRLTNFNITAHPPVPMPPAPPPPPPPPPGPSTGLKAFSTMFPDACTQPNVLAAIQNAVANGAWAGGNFVGPSGPTCQAGAPPASFNILVVFNAAGQVRTAYPNY